MHLNRQMASREPIEVSQPDLTRHSSEETGAGEQLSPTRELRGDVYRIARRCGLSRKKALALSAIAVLLSVLTALAVKYVPPLH